MRIIKNCLFILIVILLTFSVKAQQVNTLYFLENVPVRHSLNPALKPISGFYLSLPVLGNTQLNFGNNSFTASSIGMTKAGLLSTLKPTTLIDANADINLLGFGFRAKNSYWSFTATSKSTFKVGLPRDLLKLGMYGNVNVVDGIPQLENNQYDLSTFGFDASSYIETALGYAYQLNEKWTAGIKLKYLHGLAASNVRFDRFMYTSGIDLWKLNVSGVGNYSIPEINPFSATSLLKPAGVGGAADLGVVFRPNDKLVFGAAVTDLGMMKWTKSPVNYNAKVNYTLYSITGFTFDELLDGVNENAITNNLIQDFVDSLQLTSSNTAFNTSLSPKINLSAEYGFAKNILSVGILSSTTIYNKTLFHSLTPSFNIHPANWLNLSLSYSLLNGRGSNIGAGIGFRLGFINAFASLDYIPTNYAPINPPLELDLSNVPVVGSWLGVQKIAKVPAKTDRLNVAIGFNIVFGNRLDSDNDGVGNRRDKCPDTPHGVIVDRKGCPLDTDGDKVPDYYDKCPDTPKEAYSTIDADGCPLDTDGDGVFDYLDKCPDTPYQAYATVDKNGCPKDTDEDGVPDYKDKCPNTPVDERALVDTLGCSQTPKQIELPQVENKPVEVANPVTQVDVDTDGDGIVDRLDRCPDLAGVASNQGCPEIKKEVKVIFQKAIRGIQFETAKFEIKPLSFVILEHVVRVLNENKNYIVEVQGHTDNEGTLESNQILSINRANAVRDYLISKGVDASRLTAVGYGQTRPVAPNYTVDGKAKNRRVEFVVSYQ